MDVLAVIARYEQGVSFACGCVEHGLHPAVREALKAGKLDPRALMHCPVHKEPWVVEAEEAPGLVPA